MRTKYLAAFAVLVAVLSAVLTATTGIHAVTAVSGGIGVVLPILLIYLVIAAQTPAVASDS